MAFVCKLPTTFILNIHFMDTKVVFLKVNSFFQAQGLLLKAVFVVSLTGS